MSNDSITIPFSSNISPGLYIVSTPIGNRSDITIRAIETLKKSDIVVCEDTRITNKLLSFYNIKKPMICYNDHSFEKQRSNILKAIDEGKIVSLVSDAGTPLISDPGYKLIRFLKNENKAVYTVPGACAAISALTISGLPSDRFTFCGFFPPKKNGREKVLEEFKNVNSVLVFYESSKRLKDTLVDIKNILGNRNVAVARELTKIYEECISLPIDELIQYYSKIDNIKGEIVILISSPDKENLSEEECITLIKESLDHKMSVKDISKSLENRTKLSKKEIYALAVSINDKNNA